MYHSLKSTEACVYRPSKGISYQTGSGIIGEIRGQGVHSIMEWTPWLRQRIEICCLRFVVRRDWNFAKSGMAAFFP